jgi:SAM-dependent methyltransferase
MISFITRYLAGQQFNPGLMGPWVNPFFLARRELFRCMSRTAHHLSGRVLDVGCGCKPYRALFSVGEYVGLEIDTPLNRASKRADFFYDGQSFPFPDQSFDGVVCNQVLEHVFDPAPFLREIRRILRPGGRMLLSVPFIWDEHEQPWDYARYSSFGLRHLLKVTGFLIIEHHKLNADVRALIQLVNAYLFKVLQTSSPALNLMLCAIFMAPLTILGVLLHRLLPANPDLYLDQLVVVGKVDD